MHHSKHHMEDSIRHANVRQVYLRKDYHRSSKRLSNGCRNHPTYYLRAAEYQSE